MRHNQLLQLTSVTLFLEVRSVDRVKQLTCLKQFEEINGVSQKFVT